MKHSKYANIAWFLKWVWKLDRRFVLYALAGVPVAAVIPLLQSFFAKVLIDEIGLGAGVEKLFVITGAFIFALMILSVLEDRMNTRKNRYIYYPTTQIQKELFRIRAYTMDYEIFETQAFKELNGYLNEDACHGNCSMEYTMDDLAGTLKNALGIVMYASLLAVIDFRILLIVCAVSVFSYFAARWQTVYFEKHKHEWEKEQRKYNYLARLSEDFPAAKDIKLYALERWLNKLMCDYQAYILMWKRKCSMRGVYAAMLSGLMTLIQDGAAYVFLIAMLFADRMSAGEFVFYFGAVSSVAAFLCGIMGDAARLSSRADRIGHYRSMMDYPNVFNHAEGCPLPECAPEIVFEDVWYRYSGAEEYTLKGLNFTIRAGESIALVGINGAGKTTLVKLLCGLYMPTKGRILVNGKDIREYNIFEYYSLISAVFQKVHPVSFTFLEFVSGCDPDRKTAERDAVSAMKLAGIYDRIASCSNGIHTHLVKGIYDDGVDLSGGEMQKLLLARAIYKDGKILVLDEPTAALDPIAENNMYMQYRDLTKGKTSVYISHRFASTRFCDRIVLMEDGVITETGTHDELMALDGRYAYMFGVQSRYYKEGEVHA